MTAPRSPAWRLAAVAGLLTVGAAAAQERREVGVVVQKVGEVVSRDDGGPSEPLAPLDSIFLHQTLFTGLRSALAAKVYPRTALLLGSGSRVTIAEGAGPEIQGCPKLEEVEGQMRLTIEPGVRLHFDCAFKVASRDLTVEALATDFALAVHRLYGTWVTVLRGRVAIRPADGSDAFELEAGEVALVRGKRVWRGRAVELGSAPPGAPPLPPLPDSPLLPSVDQLPRSP